MILLYKVLFICLAIYPLGAHGYRNITTLNEYSQFADELSGKRSRPSLAYPSYLGCFFVSMSLIIGVIIRAIMLWSKITLPYRVVMFALGGIAGFCANTYPSFQPVVYICYEDIEALLIVFLPILVFNTSYNIEHHSFTRCFPQIILVAVPGALFTAFITSFMAYYLIESSWTFSVALLFGIVTASIYPIEMVEELKTMSKGKYLSVLLLGEGLLGDVTVMISFYAVYGYLAYAVTRPAQICLFLLRYVGGGTLLGLLMGNIISSLVTWTYTDSVCAVTITFSASLLTYYVGEKFLYVSGLMATVIVGAMISKIKSSLAAEVEQILLNFWKIMAHAANTLVFTMAGVVIFEKLTFFISVRQVAMCLVTYGTVIAARFVVYAMMMPILKKVGYGMTWHKCMACVWGGLKGPLSLCLALMVLEMPTVADNTGEIFIIQTAGLVILSLLINATTIRKVLKLLGLCEISLAKKANMTNCVKRIMATRDRCISMLKMDKFLADANWDLVHEGTQIKHPYRITMTKYDEEDDDDENYMGYRYTTCPDCEREVPNEPTKKEFAEMMREANQRVFKALKISYWRQYENGKISKDGVKILVQAVDVAADSGAGRINLEALGTLWKPKRYAVWIRNKLVQMMTPKAANAQIPHSACRQSCYRLVTNIWFDVFIYICIILNTPVILYEVVMGGPSSVIATYTIKILNLLFYMIYFFEMVIKMVALGFGGYFSSNWNKLDFFILVMATVDLILDVIDTASDWDKWRSVNFSVVTATKLLRMLRFLRLFRLARVSVPKLMAYLDRMIDIQLAFGYDVGKGFVTGDQEVCTLLPQLVDNVNIQEVLIARLEADRVWKMFPYNKLNQHDIDASPFPEVFNSLAVTRQLGLLQRDRPWTAITVKTRQATTSTLNIMLLDAAQLKEEGFLDEVEYKLLVSAIREKVQLCRHKGSLVAPSAPETQLRAISWLQGIDRVADFFIENSEILNFNYNDVLVSKGEEPKGLYILVSGLLEATYLPPDPENEEALPNYDFFTDLKFGDPCQDYIVSGNAVGVVGVLTNRPYSYTVRCESAVQAYYITMPIMKEAFNIAPHPILGLQSSMWREIGIKLSMLILPTVPAYHVWASERLSMRLEHAFVPCLKAFKVFVVNELMEDVILLDGICQDMNTHEMFKPPCYIPRTTHRLVFPTSSRLIVSDSCPDTRLLVVPAKDTDEMDLMEDEVDDLQCEMVSNVSSRCLYHRAIRKLSTESRKPVRRVPSKRRRARRVNYRNRSLSALNTPYSTASLAHISNEKEPANTYFGPANPALPEESTTNLSRARF